VPAHMHEGILEAWAFVRYETYGFGEVVLSHVGLEVGGGLVFCIGLLVAPLHEEAVGQTAKHAQHPQGIGVAHPAPVVIEGDIQALMESAFDPPRLSVGQQPLPGLEGFVNGS